MGRILKGPVRSRITCRSIVFSLGQVSSFENDHGQSVGGGLVTQGEK